MAKVPQQAQRQRGYARLLGKSRQDRQENGGQELSEPQGRSALLVVGDIRQKGALGEKTGQEVGATDYTGYCLGVNWVHRKQQSRYRLSQTLVGQNLDK